jgi:hypothetical protein
MSDIHHPGLKRIDGRLTFSDGMHLGRAVLSDILQHTLLLGDLISLTTLEVGELKRGRIFIFRTYAAVALVSISLAAHHTVMLSDGLEVCTAMTSTMNFDLLDDWRAPGDRA